MKYIVHYDCIENPRKLCPICPSTDVKTADDLETPTEQSSSIAQKKRSNEYTGIKLRSLSMLR
jgi:hypothetical protein